MKTEISPFGTFEVDFKAQLFSAYVEQTVKGSLLLCRVFRMNKIKKSQKRFEYLLNVPQTKDNLTKKFHLDQNCSVNLQN